MKKPSIAKIKEFKEYVLSFYGTEGIYKDFFPKPLTEKEIDTAIMLRLRGGPVFDGDSVDREFVRDILFRLRGETKTEYDVSKYVKDVVA